MRKKIAKLRNKKKIAKKILLISFEYPLEKSYCGGVGQVVKQCRKVLTDLGYEVYVLISVGFQKKYPVRLLMPDDSLIGYTNFTRFIKKYPWGEFDCVIQHFVNWTGELREIKQRKAPRPKIIYHFHSILRREKDSGFNTLNRFLLNQEKMIALSDKIICPSLYEYNNFVRYFPSFSDKVSVIENVIETFPPQTQLQKNIRKKYGVKNNDVVLIYVGRLERIKGAHILMRDIPMILKKYRKTKIFIIGKTLESSIYRKLKAVQNKFPDQLFYIKYLPKNVLFQYYHLGDIYINPSLSESFSLSTYESAFCKNALLLSQIPVFDNFKNAALFFSSYDNNDEGLPVQIESLVGSKLLRERFAGRAAVAAKYFLKRNRMKGDFIKLFKSL